MNQAITRRQLLLVLPCLLMALPAWAGEFMSPGLAPEALQATLGSLQAPLIVDLRKPVEYRVGHIPGAVNIPLDDLDAHLDAMRHKHGVLIYCINGSRTREAEPVLYANGIDKLYHLEGAFQQWIKDRRPFEKGGVKKSGW